MDRSIEAVEADGFITIAGIIDNSMLSWFHMVPHGFIAALSLVIPGTTNSVESSPKAYVPTALMRL